MVKIVDRRREPPSLLEFLREELKGGGYAIIVEESDFGTTYWICKGFIFKKYLALVSENGIRVDNLEIFELSKKLANRYEKVTKEKITITISR